MDHRELDDRALLTLARDGSAPAFAALVHRHFSAVDAVLGPTTDSHRARIKVFVRAMRRLDQATGPFSDWITQIAHEVAPDRSAKDGGADGEDTSGSKATSALRPATLNANDDSEACDLLWRELATRWPHGRRPVRVPTVVTWLATLLVAVALSAAVPWMTLGQFGADDAIPALRAFPIDSEGSPAAPDQATEEEPEPLPTYEFPIPPAPDEPPAREEPPVQEEPPAPDEPPAQDEPTAEQPENGESSGG